MQQKIIVGTRGSALARTQTEWVVGRLASLNPDLVTEVVTIVTDGDRSQSANIPLSSFGEKGIFAKELEAALLTGEIDVAVHSMKDLAAELPAGLCLAAIPIREDVCDVIVGARLADLPPSAVVGTGSVRRTAILRDLRPDLKIAEIRGNVDTRIRKMRDGQYDAIILAAAGINRLGRSAEIAEYLDPLVFVPDPGQGALAIQTRTDDAATRSIVNLLTDTETDVAVRAERAFLGAMSGGCQTPIGAWARMESGAMTMTCLHVDGSGSLHRRTTHDSGHDPQQFGAAAAVAMQTLADGVG